MDNPPPICPKCQGPMVRGYVPDYSHAAVFAGYWHPGDPEKSFWTGTKTRSRADLVPIGAFRCELCGFLEFYAAARFAPK